MMTSFDEENKEGKNVHHVYCVQAFTIERAHNIPSLAPAIQQKLNELWKSKE